MHKTTIQSWPSESKEAAELVIKKHGEPNEMTDSMLIWNNAGPWKRIVAYKEFHKHDFPVPHIDAVESVLEYGVPIEKFSELAAYDGSVVVKRTNGEISATCHDEEANFLALNLSHDIITGAKTVEQARDYYAKEFLDYRKGKPTPYMEKLRFETQGGADPDMRVISDEDLESAIQEGSN